MEIRIDRTDGPLVAQVEIPNNMAWKVIDAMLAESPSGVHDLFVTLKDAKTVEIDWLKFE